MPGSVVGMCVVPDRGSTWCGRPAVSSAADRRSVCAGTTLSSAMPCTSSSGRRSAGASSRSDERSYASGSWSGWPRKRSDQWVSYRRWSMAGAPATAAWNTSGRRSTAAAASVPP